MAALDQDLQQAIRKTMVMGQLTQAEVARGARTSGAVVSQILNSTPDKVLYRGSLETMQKKLRAFVKRESQRLAAPQPPAFVKTDASAAILEVLQYSHAHRTMGVIVGPPGIGKSFTINHYADEVGDITYLQADQSWSMKGALVCLAEAIGIPGDCEAWRLVQRIVSRVTDTGMLIVVDEAQFLDYDTLETFRCIHDRAKMALVYAGMQRLYDNMAGRRRGLYSHMFSRVARCAVLSGSVTRKDVERLVKEMFEGVKDEELVQFERIANEEAGGHLRTLVQMLTHLKRHMSLSKEALSPQLIREAGNLLMNVEPGLS